MTEKSFGWANNATGDGGNVSVVDSAAMLALMGTGRGAGIIWGALNNLRAAVDGSHILVATGWAVGKTGHFYRNDAEWDSGSLTPSVGTTGHRLVLREDLTAQTVRLYDIASADGTATIPAATSEDITVATFTITTGGVITLTDCREFRVGTEIVKYYSGTAQAKSASTTFEDVVADIDDAIMSIPLVEGSVWEFEFDTTISLSGTGGAKFQVSGPGSGSPSALIASENTILTTTSTTDSLASRALKSAGPVGFGSDIGAADAASGATSANNGKYDSGATNRVRMHGRIKNGTVAGKAVVQFAQNSANGTTTLGAGVLLRARRAG